ncbi:hypothetical protein KEM55_005387, partial [Ascosphaera atra]
EEASKGKYISLTSSFSRPSPPLTLDDKFDSLKEIGDGSFGSVVLARTRTAASHIAKRGTLVAIKTMKKSFESFDACLDLREVVFLRSLPPHPHLVPALDIFLDPMTRKLHIAMEYMDGNLYQLMKARHHHLLDPAAVKSILFQIMAGLEHIHAHGFFHRDIKPENILISTPKGSSSSSPTGATHPYTVKIADFGLARQIASRHPYTTYVSTRWYRAPEVLLRAGTYSAPVDLWAVGAMAVEIATLKPLFPGRNEVDQVWRVCEIMGSPGTWFAGPNGNGAVEGRQTSSSSSERSYASSAASSYSHPQSSSSHSNPNTNNTTKAQQIGGGEWKDGVRLANKLGFSFPKIAPHSIHSILPSPACGPPSLARFVGWCLMWDPKNRPTARQALRECEYFREYAVDGSIPVAGTGTGAGAGSGSGTNPAVNQTPAPANATAGAGVAAAGRRLLPRRRASEKVVAGAAAGTNTTAAQSPQQQQPTLTQQQAQTATAQFPNQTQAQSPGQAQSPRPSWFRRSLIAGVSLGNNNSNSADTPRTTRRVSSHFSRHAGYNNPANANADAASTISPSPSTASLTPTITSTSTGNNATGVKKTTLASRNSYNTVNTNSHSRHPSVTSTYSTNTNGTANAGNAGNAGNGNGNGGVGAGNGPSILPKISKRATWANGEPAPARLVLVP